MPWYVYIAQCNDRSLYAGIAKHPEARVREHNAGRGSKYVRSRGSARLVYVKRCASESSARRREAALKTLTRVQKLALVHAAQST